MDIDRRTTLALLGAGVLQANLATAQRHAHALKTDAKAYKLQFFTAQENDLLDRVAEMILPADDHSPGAHEAKVSLYIDLVAANSPESTQRQWKERLAAFASEFGKLAGPEQAAMLNRLAAAEKNPGSPAEHFFVYMKRATLAGYYTSQVGLLKELGYKGNAVRSGFQDALVKVIKGPAVRDSVRFWDWVWFFKNEFGTVEPAKVLALDGHGYTRIKNNNYFPCWWVAQIGFEREM